MTMPQLTVCLDQGGDTTERIYESSFIYCKATISSLLDIKHVWGGSSEFCIVVKSHSLSVD